MHCTYQAGVQAQTLVLQSTSTIRCASVLLSTTTTEVEDFRVTKMSGGGRLGFVIE